MDTEQRQLGQMRIERQAEDLLYGTFMPGPAFPNVAQLFHEFEAAVEVQALPVIETLDAAIAALGLHLRWPEAREPITVQDVQIWSDGTITCRLCAQPITSAKVAPHAQSSCQTAQKTNRRTLRRTPVVKRQTSPESGFGCVFPPCWSWRRQALATCSVVVSLSRYGHPVSAPNTS
jgi:hypothetical protein